MTRSLALALLFCLVACEAQPAVYTLYRNSALDPSMRVHVATFDSREGGVSVPAYNQLNCAEAAELYNRNDTERKHWWCEGGRFRP